MAHILLNWTNLALFEAGGVPEAQRIDRKLPTGQWTELAGATITAGVGDGKYTCQDATIPAPAEEDVIVQYRIAHATVGGDVLGNVVSVTIPKVPNPAVADLTGEYVE